MTTPRGVKNPALDIVGVIASPADWQTALRMRRPPDFFELRLDCLHRMTVDLERKISTLQAPIIITARDPREGGANNLSLKRRRDLLMRFLPHADYIDVELRSVRAFNSLLELARERNVGRIISFHDFKATPSPRSLCAKARAARRSGANIFKVASRTDTPTQLASLVDFLLNKNVDLAVSAMGIGKLGAISRLLLARCGSVLSYGSLARLHVEGQLPIDTLRYALGR